MNEYPTSATNCPHPDAPNPAAQKTTEVTRANDICCIIWSGTTYAKLQRIKPNSAEEITFNLKFARYVNDKYIQLTTGGGVPILARIEDTHISASGIYATGVITRVASSDSMLFGKHFSQYLDDIPSEWLRPGNRIKLLHRGAASQGFVIDIIQPDPDNESKARRKIHFCTKSTRKTS